MKTVRSFMMKRLRDLDTAALLQSGTHPTCPINHEPTGFDIKTRRGVWPSWCSIYTVPGYYEDGCACDGAQTGHSCQLHVAIDTHCKEGRHFRTLRRKTDIRAVLETMQDICDHDDILKHLP